MIIDMKLTDLIINWVTDDKGDGGVKHELFILSFFL